MMEDFERELRNALTRKDPSAGFDSRVLEAAIKQPARATLWIGRLRWASALAVAALLVMGIVWQRERVVQERVAGEAAKASLKLALRITSDKLSKIQERVDRNE